MAKRSSRGEAPYLNRKVLHRRERENRLRRWLIIGTSVVLGLTILLLGWGIYDQYVLRPRQPVAVVSGEPIRLSWYRKVLKNSRLQYQNYIRQLQTQRQQFASGDEDQQQNFLLQYIDSQIQQMQSQYVTLDETLVDQLVNDAIIRQEADERGITVTEDEITERIQQEIGYDPNPPTPVPGDEITATTPITGTPTPTIAPMTLEEFQETYDRQLEIMRNVAGMTEQDYRRLVATSIYSAKVQEAIKATVPTTAEQVHAKHILVETREEAEEVLERLDAGEEWDDLAAEFSTDTSNAEQGGDLGWFPRGRMTEPFEEAAFALEPGETSDIVETSFGFHIIRVLEKAEDRPLDPQDLQATQDQAFQEWLDAQREAKDIENLWEPWMAPEDLYNPFAAY
jgi:parvulin-like peptidyl-prolyl isomerase